MEQMIQATLNHKLAQIQGQIVIPIRITTPTQLALLIRARLGVQTINKINQKKKVTLVFKVPPGQAWLKEMTRAVTYSLIVIVVYQVAELLMASFIRQTGIN